MALGSALDKLAPSFYNKLGLGKTLGALLGIACLATFIGGKGFPKVSPQTECEFLASASGTRLGSLDSKDTMASATETRLPAASRPHWRMSRGDLLPALTLA